jgi:hypothetical protein
MKPEFRSYRTAARLSSIFCAHPLHFDKEQTALNANRAGC